MWDASTNPADYGENMGRGMRALRNSYIPPLILPYCAAIACEVLARRVVHLAPSDKTVSMLSTRFRFKEVDEDISEKASALELAVDSHWYVLEPLPCLLRSHTFAQYDLLVFHGGAGW